MIVPTIVLLSLSLSVSMCLAQDKDACKACIYDNQVIENAAKAGFLNHPQRIEWEYGGFYEGIFDDGTPFQMDLPYPTPDSIKAKLKDDPYSPSAGYWNPRLVTSQDLKALKMTLNGDKFTLSEERGETFSGNFSNGKADASGQWVSLDKKESRQFSMKRIYSQKSVTVYVYMTCKEHKRGWYTYRTSFPVLADSKLDNWIKKMLVDHGKEELRVRLVWASKNKSQIALYGYNYNYDGPPYGATSAFYKFFIKKAGSYTAVEPKEFLNLSKPCSAKLKKKLVSGLKAQNMNGPEGDALNASLLSPWVSPSGVYFFYTLRIAGAGHIADEFAYYDVFIGKDQLGDCVNKLPSYEVSKGN